MLFRIIACLSIFTFSFAVQINIPDDYQQIQDGIDNTVDGDTVLVQPGTYVENINFNGKNITVGSLFLLTQDTSYISQTIVDGDSSGSVITFMNDENDAVLTGLTITNGYANDGAGIDIYSANPGLNNLIINNNFASGNGGGIRIVSSNIEMNNILIIHNNSGGFGSAIYTNGSTIIANNFVIKNNGLDYLTSIIRLLGNSTFNNSEFIGNFGTDLILSSNSYTNINVNFCKINMNQATSSIIRAHKPTINLYKTQIFSNSANIIIDQDFLSGANLDNVTIANNIDVEKILYIHTTYGFSSSISNSIIFGNSNNTIQYQNGTGSLVVEYSNIQNGINSVMGSGGNFSLVWLEGNIDADPLFFAPDSGDFTLSPDSPCIDAGDPGSLQDPDGTIADMGALYFDQSVDPAIIDSVYTDITVGTAPLTVTFSADVSGLNLNWTWEFGDGTISNESQPTHLYPTPGTYSVSLIVDNEFGSDNFFQENMITVLEPTLEPMADFTADTTFGYESLDVNFFNLTNGIEISSFTWDFGDGTLLSENLEAVVSHIYDSIGVFDVSLTAINPYGFDTEIKEGYIVIEEYPEVLADFSVSASQGIVPLWIEFTNQSINGLSYFWDFGDGSTSTNENPVQEFTSSGEYNITLLTVGEFINDTTVQTLSFFHEAPEITIISDIPNDQGGYVYLTFRKSGFDTDTPENRLESYQIERLDEDNWVGVTTYNGYGQNSYTAEVHTLMDSTSANDGLTAFRVIAVMDEGIWISDTTWGYSVDNIAPEPPSSFFAEIVSNGVELSWTASNSEDLSYYQIFRNSEIIGSTASSTILDNNIEYGTEYFYSIQAVDIHNNVSISSDTFITVGMLGDLNFDDNIDVTDIVIVLNHILEFELIDNLSLQFADLNQDGMINVVDIINMVTIILEVELSMVDNSPITCNILISNNSIRLSSDNNIVGYELNVSGDFEIKQYNIPSGWKLGYSNRKIILYSMSLEEFDQDIEINFTGEFQYHSGIAANIYGNVIELDIIEVPQFYYLASAYPNPFNPVTTIEFGVPVVETLRATSLHVYDITGRLVSKLIHGTLQPGIYKIEWNAAGLPGGIYLVRLETEQFTDVQKVLLMK